MKITQPFGNPKQAAILVIGHDPRLQRSKAEAEFAFFFEYLLHDRPASKAEDRKYDLAKGVLDYVSDLACQSIPIESLYITNLCNEFLPPTNGSGTVLIPDHLAEQGAQLIAQAISQGQFRLILPMSQQVNYHLARLGFFDENTAGIQKFIQATEPKPDKAAQGIYTCAGKAPFLNICGQRFHHQGIPVVPILHVKQWPLSARAVRYTEPMEQARQQVSQILR